MTERYVEQELAKDLVPYIRPEDYLLSPDQFLQAVYDRLAMALREKGKLRVQEHDEENTDRSQRLAEAVGQAQGVGVAGAAQPTQDGPTVPTVVGGCGPFARRTEQLGPVLDRTDAELSGPGARAAKRGKEGFSGGTGGKTGRLKRFRMA